jgi:hypothetical protein
MTTAVTTRTSSSARSVDVLSRPRNAALAETPTSTNRALLSTVVDRAQNGTTICRVTAPVIREVT